MIRETNLTYTGTSSDNRSAPAMAADYVKMDELSSEDLLVLAYGLSHLLRYYDDSNKHSGDWSEVLNDEMFVLAEIVKVDLSKYEESFKYNMEQALLFRRIERKARFIENLLENVFQAAFLVDNWLSTLIELERTLNKEIKLRETIDNIYINSLNKAFYDIIKVQKEIETNFNLELQLNYTKNHSKYYEPQNLTENNSIENSNNEEKNDEEVTEESIVNIKDLIISIENGFNSFYQAIYFLKSKSENYLKELLQRNDHLPQISLLLTFFTLYKESQENINSFNERFLSFYHKEHLNFKPKKRKADKVYLAAEVLEDATHAIIEQGERFVAGEDEFGTTIIYKADEAIQINQVKIEKLYNSFIGRRFLKYRGIKYSYITGIFASELPSAIYTEEQNENPVQVFGFDQKLLSILERNMDDAELGFAFSSKNLFLGGGKRDIDLDLIFTKVSFEKFNDKLGDFSSFLEKSKHELSELAFIETFELHLSSSNGWYKVQRLSLKIDDNTNKLTIKFTIPEEAPAIVAIDEELHSGAFVSNYPVLKCLLKPDAYIYAYSLLQELNLERINVSVNVENLKNVSLFNHFGQLDENSIYQPFGPTPKKNNFFLIGSNEVFNKEFNALSIHFNWFELPDIEGGFEEHYEKYGLDYTNESFKVTLSILDEGRWKPFNSAERQEFNLFEEDEDGHLSDSRSFDEINISKIWKSFEDNELGNPKEYTNQVRSGYIKFELSEPEFGFGHDVYPSLLSKLMSKKGKRFSFGKSKDEASDLNKPYTPQMQGVSLSYKSSSTITFDDVDPKLSVNKEAFYHLFPQGIVKTYPNISVRDMKILPEFNFEGAFFIGLSGVNAPQIVNFLFEIVETGAESSEEKDPVIEWDILSNDQWISLEQSKIYIEETEGFRQTGRIQLEIPASITRNNSQLDKDLYWIRARAIKNTTSVGSIISSHTGAFTATIDYTEEYSNTVYESVLPAHTIESPAGNVTGLANVLQPLPSFAGKQDEPKDGFHIRISEKLRHKNRAITAGDIERLILEKFKVLYNVTCFPNLSGRANVSPGNVMVIVIPYLKYSLDKQEPKVGNKLLVEIKAFLQKISTPFVKYEVRNPEYEHIKVVCSVKFGLGFSQGFYTRELNDSIYRFLSGTESSEKTRTSMGGGIHISDLLSYMRSLPYIDSVGKLSMLLVARVYKNTYRLIDTAGDDSNKEYLQSTKPWSILTSFDEHEISIVKDDDTAFAEPSGIGKLRLGTEFIIS